MGAVQAHTAIRVDIPAGSTGKFDGGDGWCSWGGPIGGVIRFDNYVAESLLWEQAHPVGTIRVPYVYPSSLVSTQAVFAMGTRAYSPSYAGPALRVHRTSDGAQTDIGFVDGWLDVSSLLSFALGGDLDVERFYDLTGAGNTFNRIGARARIVTAGVVETQNGKPCARAYANDVKYIGNTVPGGMSEFVLSAVANLQSSSGYGRIVSIQGSSNGNDYCCPESLPLLQNMTSGAVGTYRGAPRMLPGGVGAFSAYQARFVGGQHEIYRNTNAPVVFAFPNQPLGTATITPWLFADNSAAGMVGYIGECSFFASPLPNTELIAYRDNQMASWGL